MLAAEQSRGPIGFVSHSEPGANSTYHVLSIARELRLLGRECVVIVPGDLPETEHSGVPILNFETAVSDGRSRAGDLQFLHAWSPREHVRAQTLCLSEVFGRPYLVHMEDNEDQLTHDALSWRGFPNADDLDDEALDGLLGPRRSHPRRYRGFIEGAVGYTCLIEPLLEFGPVHGRAEVFWPGFEPAFTQDPTYRDNALRAELGVSPDELVVFYPGNTHRSNVEEVRELYAGVALAARWGVPIRLIRTGVSHAPLNLDPGLHPPALTLELGYVERDRVPRLMAAADVLIQPGRAGPFNDYRFPSKLPEFLASGRPTVLPFSNLGRVVQDGVEALVLRRGTVDEIAYALQTLWLDPQLRVRLGTGGRKFALEQLSWRKAALKLDRLYEALARGEANSPAEAA